MVYKLVINLQLLQQYLRRFLLENLITLYISTVCEASPNFSHFGHTISESCLLLVLKNSSPARAFMKF